MKHFRRSYRCAAPASTLWWSISITQTRRASSEPNNVPKLLAFAPIAYGASTAWTSGDAMSRRPGCPSWPSVGKRVAGKAAVDSLTEPTSTPRPLGRFANFVLPPDFYPERKVEASTWAEAIFEPAMLIGAVVCFVLGIVHLGQSFSPGWPTRFLTPLAILVGIEAFLYSRRLARG